MRLQRRVRQRQHSRQSSISSSEVATPAQPIEARDGRQTHGGNFERTQDEVVRHLIDRLEGRNGHIRTIEEEAARLWAETVLLESEIQASRRQARWRSAAASPWGDSVGAMVLHQILLDENVEQGGNQNRSTNRNHPLSSNVLDNEEVGRSSRPGQSPEEGRRIHSGGLESSMALAHIGEHIMWVFNDLRAEERPAMAAWIVLMAAAQVRRDMASAGE